MHSQFNFKMLTCLFYSVKRIVVIPGITGETNSSCGRPALFGSRVLYEIGSLRHIVQALPYRPVDISYLRKFYCLFG